MKILRLMNCYNFFMVNGWRFVKIMLLQFMKIFKTFSLGLGSFLVLVEVKIETDMLIISDVFFPLYFPAVRKTAGQYTKPLTSKFTIFWTHVVCQLAVDCHIWPLVFFFFPLAAGYVDKEKVYRYSQMPSSILKRSVGK